MAKAIIPTPAYNSRYMSYRQPGDPIKPLDRIECKVKGCNRSPYSKNMCKTHADMAFYKAQQRKGC